MRPGGPTTLEAEGRDGPDGPAVLIVDQGAGELLCVSGADVQRRAWPAGVSLHELVRGEADVFQRQYTASARKHRFNERFVVFVERLNRADEEDDVLVAALDDVPPLLDVHAIVLFLRDPRADPTRLAPVANPPIAAALAPIDDRLAANAPFTLTRADARPDSPFARLGTLFDDVGSTTVACASLGAVGLLAAIERRAGAALGGEDWFRLQTVSRHVGRTLERVRGGGS